MHRDYFLVETPDDNIPQIKSAHPSWRYEHRARAVGKYHVFSRSKKIPGRLLARDESDFFPTGPIRSLALLPPKKLVNRAVIPHSPNPRRGLFGDSGLFERASDSSQQIIEDAREEFGIDDPKFSEQWHLVNAQFPGEDVDVLPVWRQNITGKGVVTAIVDDGLDFENPDLKNSFCPEGSWDYNDNTALPRPKLNSDYHGTRCAGEIAAARGNGFCGVGVAYDSRVSGVRILSGELTAEDEAAAMVYALAVNDIYSCSWGPPDSGRAMDVPDKIVREAILRGVQEGREGKGALYVFASGNGALQGDTCNFDGYTNSIYSITVTSIDHKGLHPPYAEECAAVMVSTYSSGSGYRIQTTDFNGGCTHLHGGTSAAAPLAAGEYALVLQANPDLSWRDVQQLTVYSAVQIHPEDASWHRSAIPGRFYSYKFGWGKLDAAKIVEMAQDNYTLLKPQAWYYVPYQRVDPETTLVDSKSDAVAVNTRDKNPWPDNSVIYQAKYHVSDDTIEKSNLDHIEQITTTVDIRSSKRGAVYVRLVSPHGIVSRLAHNRPHDIDVMGFNNWTFSSVAHWGEKPAGNWTIQVINTEPENEEVKFEGWQLKMFGECVDPDKAVKFDMDKDYSDDKNLNSSIVDTTSDSISSTVILTSTSPTVSLTPTVNSSITSSTTTSSIASSTNSPDKSTHPDLLSRGHSDLYFISLLIIGFLVCLWMLKCRKKPGRARRRDEYEFDIINPDDDDDDDSDDDSLDTSIQDSTNDTRTGNDDDMFNANTYSEGSATNAFTRQNEEREQLFKIDSK